MFDKLDSSQARAVSFSAEPSTVPSTSLRPLSSVENNTDTVRARALSFLENNTRTRSNSVNIPPSEFQRNTQFALSNETEEAIKMMLSSARNPPNEFAGAASGYAYEAQFSELEPEPESTSTEKAPQIQSQNAVISCVPPNISPINTPNNTPINTPNNQSTPANESLKSKNIQILDCKVNKILGSGAFKTTLLIGVATKQMALSVVTGPMTERDKAINDYEGSIHESLRGVSENKRSNIAIGHSVVHLKSGQKAIISNFCNGGDVNQFLKNKNEQPKAAAKNDFSEKNNIAAGLTRGLRQMHNQGVVHRDINAGNLFLHKNDAGKIIDCSLGDLGASAFIDKAKRPNIDLNLPVHLLGPEILLLKPGFEEAFFSKETDVYQCGIALMQLYSNTSNEKLPFSKENIAPANTLAPRALYQKIAEERAAYIKEYLNSDAFQQMPEKYREIMPKVLDENPNNRPTMLQVEAVFKKLQMSPS